MNVNLISWNVMRLKNLLEEFVVIDIIQESRNLTKEEIMIVAIIIVELKYFVGQDESIWKTNQ